MQGYQQRRFAEGRCHAIYGLGGLAEWLKAAVYETVDDRIIQGFESLAHRHKITGCGLVAGGCEDGPGGPFSIDFVRTRPHNAGVGFGNANSESCCCDPAREFAFSSRREPGGGGNHRLISRPRSQTARPVLFLG